jgi:hypothetical protein
LAEFCIKNTCSPYAVEPKDIGAKELPEDMTEAVAKYVDYLISVASFKDIQTEVRFHLDYINEDMFGTCDAMIYDKARCKLRIVDYKHGRGEVVEAKDNPQLRYYALGAVSVLLADTGKEVPAITTIDMTIVQPRAYHEDGPIRTETMTLHDLYLWEKEVLVPAVRRIEKKDTTLNQTPKGCRWCKAKVICPEVQKAMVAVAQTDFANPVFPLPEILSMEQLVKVLKFSEGFEGFADQCKAYAQMKAEAGIEIPGYKLVKGRSVRQWDESVNVEENLKMLLGDAAYERKLKSPAQVEKTIKELTPKGTKSKVTIEHLVVKPEGKLKLVPADDSREPVCASPAIDYIDVFN